MKNLLSVCLGLAFATLISTSGFAACSHGYVSADMSNLKIAADTQKPEEAMSTFDPAKVGELLDVEETAEEIKTSE